MTNSVTGTVTEEYVIEQLINDVWVINFFRENESDALNQLTHEKEQFPNTKFRIRKRTQIVINEVIKEVCK